MTSLIDSLLVSLAQSFIADVEPPPGKWTRWLTERLAWL